MVAFRPAARQRKGGRKIEGEEREGGGERETEKRRQGDKDAERQGDREAGRQEDRERQGDMETERQIGGVAEGRRDREDGKAERQGGWKQNGGEAERRTRHTFRTDLSSITTSSV